MPSRPTDYMAHERRLLWPDRQRGPWLLVFWYVELDGRVECVGFEMRSIVKDTERDQEVVAPEGPRRLTASTLDRVAFDGLQHEARESGGRYTPRGLVKILESLGADPEKTLEWWQSLDRKPTTAPGPGRPRTYGPDHFLEVATVYSAADRHGRPATKAVQEHFAEKWGEDVKRGQAAKWVHRARHEFGFLEETEARQQGGQLTEEAQRHRAPNEKGGPS